VPFSPLYDNYRAIIKFVPANIISGDYYMKYDFDTVIDRRDSGSVKWDLADKLFQEKNILPMWVADMDFRSPPQVIDAMKRTAERGFFGYTFATSSYYDSIIDWMKTHHRWDIQADWVVQTPGVVSAIDMLVQTFTEPGDKIIVHTPAYYPFFNAINNNNRRILRSPLKLKDGLYRMDTKALEKNIDSYTKMIILCSPHNPVGRVWEEAELREIGELCFRHNILVISDEIHADIVYPGNSHIPFATLGSEFASRSITCTAASKTFNLPGLKTSNIIISNTELRDLFRQTLINNGCSSTGMFGVAATEAAYRYGGEWLEQLLAYLWANIEYTSNYLSERIPGARVIQSQGTYLLWLDLRNIGIKQSDIHDIIIKEAKVGVQAGTLFGSKEEGFERMNIACPRALLTEALQRIERALLVRINK